MRLELDSIGESLKRRIGKKNRAKGAPRVTLGIFKSTFLNPKHQMKTSSVALFFSALAFAAALPGTTEKRPDLWDDLFGKDEPSPVAPGTSFIEWIRI